MLWPPSGRSLIIPGAGPEQFFVKIRIAARKMESEKNDG
jgi:hypothetical protein